RDRPRGLAHTTQGLVASRARAVRVRVHGLSLGEPPDPAARGDAVRALRRAADRADGDQAPGPVRDGEGGDRLMALLELKGVSKAFGGLQVISSLDFHVAEHEIVSVIGPNGAGKTTLFNLVTGIYSPDEGEIAFDGQSLIGLPPHKITRLGVARTFQTLRLFLNMTVKENVMPPPTGTRARVCFGRCCGRPACGARSGRTTS